MRGIELLTRLVEPTLGPLPRIVLVEPVTGDRPEPLDSAATITRRVYQLASPAENVGAMLLRHLTWRVFEAVGDGTATAAVITRSLLHEAHRVIAAGADPISFRRGLELGRDYALQTLRCQATPVPGRGALAAVVAGALHDTDLSRMVAEVLESVGVDGAILIEDALGTQSEYEYIDGMRWNDGWHSPAFQQDGGLTVRQTEPLILLTDTPIEKPAQLLPAIEACLKTDSRELFIVTPSISDAALATLLVNRERGVLRNAVAVHAPSHGPMSTSIVQDLAIWTGGRCVSRDAGDRLEDITAADLGSARQAWARRAQFCIIGGRGDRAALRTRIGQARAELRDAGDDTWLRNRLSERIGKLAGTAAIIQVGAPTQAARDELKVRLEAGIAAGRAALRDGVVAGGGMAYCICAARLEEYVRDRRSDDALAMQLLAQALTRPMRIIARNAGYEPEPIVDQARQRGPDATFDVLKGAWVDPWLDGPLDAVAVLEAVLTTSISLAGTVLMSDVVIHRRNPPVSSEP
jgi:chaperonin GroEL